MSRVATFLVSASILLPAGFGAAGASPARDGRFEEGIELASSEVSLESGDATTEFDFFELRDLWVRVKVKRPSRLATLKLTFTDPDGGVAYEATLLFTTDPKTLQGKVNGAPTSALRAKRIPGGFAFDYPVGIADSVFQRYPRSGTWQVEAEVESTRTWLTLPFDVVYGGQ